MNGISMFIVGLILSNIKVNIKGVMTESITLDIRDKFPEFFSVMPYDYEALIGGFDTTKLLVYLYNAAGCGSVKHLWAFVNLAPIFIDKMEIVFEDDFNDYLKRCYGYDCLDTFKSKMWYDYRDDFRNFYRHIEIAKK